MYEICNTGLCGRGSGRLSPWEGVDVWASGCPARGGFHSRLRRGGFTFAMYSINHIFGGYSARMSPTLHVCSHSCININVVYSFLAFVFGQFCRTMVRFFMSAIWNIIRDILQSILDGGDRMFHVSAQPCARCMFASCFANGRDFRDFNVVLRNDHDSGMHLFNFCTIRHWVKHLQRISGWSRFHGVVEILKAPTRIPLDSW